MASQPYKVLGLDVSEKDDRTIKQVARRMMQKEHPDKLDDKSAEAQEIGARRVQLINAAKEAIESTDRRIRYLTSAGRWREERAARRAGDEIGKRQEARYNKENRETGSSSPRESPGEQPHRSQSETYWFRAGRQDSPSYGRSDAENGDSSYYNRGNWRPFGEDDYFSRTKNGFRRTKKDGGGEKREWEYRAEGGKGRSFEYSGSFERVRNPQENKIPPQWEKKIDNYLRRAALLKFAMEMMCGLDVRGPLYARATTREIDQGIDTIFGATGNWLKPPIEKSAYPNRNYKTQDPHKESLSGEETVIIRYGEDRSAEKRKEEEERPVCTERTNKIDLKDGFTNKFMEKNQKTTTEKVNSNPSIYIQYGS